MNLALPQDPSFPPNVNPHVRTRPTPSPAMKEVASWYTPGLVDGFGDRLLMFDNTDSEPLEVLRFHRAIAATPGFEEALLARVDQVAGLRHRSFARIRAAVRLEGDDALALVSTHTPGKRVSDVLADPSIRTRLSAASVIALLRQVVDGLSALHLQGEGVAHSAVTAERIVLMPGARICITEHALGAAIGRLRLSPLQLWREFGVLVPATSLPVAPLDVRADVFQAGILGLSLLLSRRVTPEDVEGRLPELVDHCSAARAASPDAERLQHWLRRALQLTRDSYGSAAEASEDLRDVQPEPITDSDFLPEGAKETNPVAMMAARLASAPEARHRVAERVAATGYGELSRSSMVSNSAVVTATEVLRLDLPRQDAPIAAPRGPAALAPPTLASRFSVRAVPLWAAVTLAVLALVQGVVVAILMWPTRQVARSNTSNTVNSAAPARVAPINRVPMVVPAARVEQPANGPVASLAAAGVGLTDAIQHSQPGTDPSSPAALAALAIERAASNQRSGGVRLSAPIDLKVLQGDRVLGSSADGPIIMNAGTYQVELINPALGFRTNQSLTFRAGQITTVTIPVPRGRISVNAEPWASVWIDDRPVGDTPLANIDIPIGEHQVAFRHPQLGERRQTVVVRADAPARVTATFQP